MPKTVLLTVTFRCQQCQIIKAAFESVKQNWSLALLLNWESDPLIELFVMWKTQKTVAHVL